MTDELDIGDVQVDALCSVTVAFSERLNVTVGFWIVEKLDGAMEVYVTVGANVSIIIDFCPERLDPPPRAGKVIEAVFPAISVIVPPFRVSAPVEDTSSGLPLWLAITV
jgi:hypothetical protein